MLRALTALSGSEKLLVAEAGIGLLCSAIAVKVLPFRHTIRIIGLSDGSAPTDVTHGQLAAAERVGWAVRGVAARTPWTNTCLMQATAGAALLRRRRIPAELRLGVVKDAAVPEGLTAHAWLTCGGLVLTGEEPNLDRYAVVGLYSVGSAQQPTTAGITSAGL